MAEEDLFSESWHLVANQKVRLRANLSIHRQNFRGEPWFLIGDPYRNQYYRIRPVAYYFLTRLDGSKTVEEVWKEALERDPESTPGQQEIIQSLSQLYQANLLASEHPSDSAQLFSRMRTRKFRSFRSQVTNFLFVRVPLWDPNEFLNHLLPLAKLLVRPAFGIVWLLVMLAGIKVVLDNFDALWSQGQGILAPGNLILLYLCWAVIKFLHECGHGLVCKRYGGEVHTMGIMFLVFMPIPYVDASSAWAFREPRRRMLVGAAGMLVELFCAAIAAFVWVSTGPGTVNQIAYNIMFLASVSTILFNGNPLLRFDGYYILSDLVDVPNLHQQSFRQQKYWLERYAFGLKGAIPSGRTLTGALGFSLFNLASTAYRLFVLTVIILFIAGQFFDLGLVIALFAIVVWGVVPVIKFLKYLFTDANLERVRVRAVGVVLVPVVLIIGALALIPFPQRFRAPGVIHGAEVAEVIAGTAGTLDELFVSPGEWVEDGEPIAALRNRELEIERAALHAERAETEARLLWAREEMPAYIEPMRVSRQAVLGRLETVERQIEKLTVAAPASGVMIAPYLQEQVGIWSRRGAPFGQVADTRKFFFSAIVSQEEAAELFAVEIRRAEIRLKGRAGVNLEGHHLRVVPVQQERLPTASLGWSAGGDIEVAQDDEEGLRTVEPFFEVRMDLEPDDRVEFRHLRSGEVRFTLDPQPLLSQWWRELRQLVQKRYQI